MGAGLYLLHGGLISRNLTFTAASQRSLQSKSGRQAKLPTTIGNKARQRHRIRAQGWQGIHKTKGTEED